MRHADEQDRGKRVIGGGFQGREVTGSSDVFGVREDSARVGGVSRKWAWDKWAWDKKWVENGLRMFKLGEDCVKNV